MILNFLHHLFNPHCDKCEELLRESKQCNSCDILKQELEIERFNNKELLRAILEHTNPKVVAQVNDEVRLPVRNNNLSWRARQQMLEAEDKQKLKLINEKKQEEVEATKSTEELEKELLGDAI